VNMLVLLVLFGTRIPVIVSERIHPGQNPIARVWFWARQVIYPLAQSLRFKRKRAPNGSGATA
jgi:hypothetical protein